MQRIAEVQQCGSADRTSLQNAIWLGILGLCDILCGGTECYYMPAPAMWSIQCLARQHAARHARTMD